MDRPCFVAIAPLLLGLLTYSAYSQEIPKYSGKVPPSITKPDTVQTRIGTLRFFHGLPDPETVQRAVASATREAAVNPSGPDLISLRVAVGTAATRVIKGGSHLCSANYCSRYRAAARQPQEVDLSAAHLGFRTVLNKPSAH